MRIRNHLRISRFEKIDDVSGTRSICKGRAHQRLRLRRQIAPRMIYPNKGLDDVEQFPHEIFTRYDIRYVIVHHNPAPIFHGKTMRIVEKKKRYLQQNLHLSLVYEDLEIAVYATQPDVEREE